MVYLICISNARVLTKSVKIDQSEGIPDPGKPSDWSIVADVVNTRATLGARGLLARRRRGASERVVLVGETVFSRRFATRLRGFAAQFCRPQREKKPLATRVHSSITDADEITIWRRSETFQRVTRCSNLLYTTR